MCIAYRSLRTRLIPRKMKVQKVKGIKIYAYAALPSFVSCTPWRTPENFGFFTHAHIQIQPRVHTYSNKHRKYTETMIKREYEFEIPQTHVFSLLIEVFIVLCSLSTQHWPRERCNFRLSVSMGSTFVLLSFRQFCKLSL